MLKENTIITNFQPHFHLRGKAMQVEAILPDGGNQIISYVDNFNFNWMTNYIYADDAAPAFPKGTIIHVTAFYDNTKANKNNPDPESVGGLRRPHGGRDGARVDERRLPDRRRIPGVAGRAQEVDHQPEPAAVARVDNHRHGGDAGSPRLPSALSHLPGPRPARERSCGSTAGSFS